MSSPDDPTGSSAMEPCLRVVIANNCAQETFTNTCIEHTSGGMTTWQCWVSSTLPGFTIDVAQCGATGRYFYYGSVSTGGFNIEQSECPTPS